MDDRRALRLALGGDFVPSLLVGLLIVANIVGWSVITP